MQLNPSHSCSTDPLCGRAHRLHTAFGEEETVSESGEVKGAPICLPLRLQPFDSVTTSGFATQPAHTPAWIHTA
jgi:hypothetical protein